MHISRILCRPATRFAIAAVTAVILSVSFSATRAEDAETEDAVVAPGEEEVYQGSIPVETIRYTKSKLDSTADHTKFKELRKKFASGREVTKACLSCHNRAAKQIQKTKHWNWEFANPSTGQKLGKKNLINNTFISLATNHVYCTSCHIGFDWDEASYDFSSEENVDCLVCHDTTGKYTLRKFHIKGEDCLDCHDVKPKVKGKGNVRRAPKLKKTALNVGPTTRETCGHCHFSGDGGDGQKHGDLDSSLTNPDKNLDVHMDAGGLNFVCTTCHHTDQHVVRGSRYTPHVADTGAVNVPAGSRATCESCHGMEPMKDPIFHKDERLNDHTDRVACQTCHIPEIARGGVPTKMWWDWSTAGRLGPDGKRIAEKDDNGYVIYTTNKGSAHWEENVVPEYVWFDGKVEYTLLGDKIDPTKVVRINKYVGGPEETEARIWPVKVLRGKQPYDADNNTFVAVHLYGDDDTAFWWNFDWDKAIAAGMKAAGVPYSGRYGFVETEMLWPITHMVAPVEKTLSCEECHAKNARLKNIRGIYIPGRDSFEILEIGGPVLVLFALFGVIFHALVRIIARLRG